MLRIVCVVATVFASPFSALAAPVCALLDPAKTPQGAILEAKLLADPVATWVERANVDAVLKEQQLQAAFGAKGVSDRVKLGKLLKADMLVLVRPVKDAKEPALEIVVSETAGGLRLLVRGIAVTKDPEADVAALQAAVHDGIKKHGEKIREVVAVPPFVSNDFEYTFDYLKRAFAKLAEAEALHRAGVVVVDLEEAQALAKELALAGGKLDRPLPVYLLGEYRHEGKDGERKLSVKLRAERGGKPVGKEMTHSGKPEDTTAAVRSWSAGILDSLLADGTTRPPGDPKAEAKLLVQRAAAFRRLGNWEEAYSLLEASLILDGDTPSVRVDAVHNGSSLLELISGQPKLETFPRIRALHAHLLEHLDSVVRIGTKEGEFNVVWTMFSSAKKGGLFHGLAKPPAEVLALHSELDAAERAFARRMVDRMAPAGPRHEAYWMFWAVYHKPIKERYASVEKALADHEKLPGARERAELYSDHVLRQSVIRPDQTYKLAPGEEDAYLAFLSRLEASKNSEYSAAAKAVRLRLKDNPLEFVRPQGSATSHPLFQPIPYQWDGPRLDRPDRIVATPGADLIWAASGLYLEKEKGRVHFVWPPKPVPGILFECARFDGRYVWFGFARNGQAPLLLVVDPKSERIWDVSDIEGVPKPNAEVFTKIYSRPAIAPLGPGRICLAGSFGRTWIATVEFDEKTGRATGKRIHEATEIQNRNDATQELKTTIEFQPAYAFALRGRSAPGNAEETRVLLGRFGYYPGRRPLLIDPEKQSVRTISAPLLGSNPPQRDLEFFATSDAVYILEEDPARAHRNRVVRIGWPDFDKKVAVEGLPDGKGLLAIHDYRIHIARPLPQLSQKLGMNTPPNWEWLTCGLDGEDLQLIAGNVPPVQSIHISTHHGLVANIPSIEGRLCTVEYSRFKSSPVRLLSARKHPAEATARTEKSVVPAKISFQNSTDRVVRIHWLDFGGRRQFFGEIPPGKAALYPTFLTHAWVVTDRNDDALEVVRTTEKEGTHTIKAPDKK